MREIISFISKNLFVHCKNGNAAASIRYESNRLRIFLMKNVG